MIDIYREDCFGCAACASVCPKDAISFDLDKLGFLYPIIDNNKCIECNLCEKICPVQTYTSSLNPIPKKVYAARHISIDEVKSSRSGAAFIAISDAILRKSGSVYGAAFEDGLKVKHIRTTCASDRDRLKGSKYVQSDVRGVIDEIKEDLENEKYVLFSGTPCQVAGVKNGIPQNKSERLYLLDILCHGVPAPSIWRDYIHYQERLHGSRITKFDFRDKSLNGWSDHLESMVFDGDNKVVGKLYTDLFYTNAFFRDCCYKCPFTTTKRTGDITLADFWGWENTDREINSDDNGVSLVFVNSTKGKDLFEESKKDLFCIPTDISLCMQRNLREPTPKPKIREEYEHYYINYGFAELVKYIFHPSFSQRVMRKIKRFLIK